MRAHNIPTIDFINVDIDAVANIRIPNDPKLIQAAVKHFLNQKSD